MSHEKVHISVQQSHTLHPRRATERCFIPKGIIDQLIVDLAHDFANKLSAKIVKALIP